MSSSSTPPPGPAQITAPDRQRWPGMLPQETAIFSAWWAVNQNAYTSSAFNVRVGKGVDPGPGFDKTTRDVMTMNSKYRIDALLYQGAQPVIVEVKYRAALTALGQLLGYRLLWMQDNPFEPRPIMLLLCNQVNEDTMYCAGLMNIPIVVQPADFTGIRIQKQS